MRRNILIIAHFKFTNQSLLIHCGAFKASDKNEQKQGVWLKFSSIVSWTWCAKIDIRIYKIFLVFFRKNIQTKFDSLQSRAGHLLQGGVCMKPYEIISIHPSLNLFPYIPLSLYLKPLNHFGYIAMSFINVWCRKQTHSTYIKAPWNACHSAKTQHISATALDLTK